MKFPLYSPDRDQYWNKVHSAPRNGLPGFPANAFDFISIHCGIKGAFSLHSPMLLVNEHKRPRFESRTFGTKAAATRYALRLARMIKKILGKSVHVVNCCEK